MFDYLAVNGKLPVCIPIIVRFDRNLIFEGKFLLDEKSLMSFLMASEILFSKKQIDSSLPPSDDTVFGCALFPHGSGRTP